MVSVTARPRLRPIGWEPAVGPHSPRGTVRLVGSCLRVVYRAGPAVLTASVGLFVVAAVAQIMGLLALRHILEEVTGLGAQLSGRVGELTPGLLWLGASLAVLSVAQLAGTALRPLLIERATAEVYERVLDAAERASLEQFDEPDFHERLSRAQNAGGRPLVITQGLMGLLGSALSVVGLGSVVLAIGVWTLVPLTLMVLPLALVQRAAARTYHGFISEFNESERRRYYLRGLLLGRSTIAETRAYGISPWIRSKHNDLLRERFAGLRRVTGRALLRALVGGLLAAAAITASIGVIFAQVGASRIGVSDAAVAAIAIVQLAAVLNTLTASLGQLYESSLFVADYEAFGAAALTELPASGRGVAGRFESLTVDRVVYAYPTATRPALDGVSLRVGRGEIVALVGANGSGKTTLAKLMCGLVDPHEGSVTRCSRDGVSGAADPRVCSVVFQDFGRYLFTIAENISLGRPASGPGEEGTIESAAQRAGAAEFVANLPEGFETQLGSIFVDGIELSTGQWQRLAIARALYRRSEVMVLDEPTASLDPLAERALFSEVRSMAGDRAVVLVSHRFSTVRQADRIYVLDEGRVVEEGDHKVLMREAGRYAAMYQAQVGAVEESAEGCTDHSGRGVAGVRS